MGAPYSLKGKQRDFVLSPSRKLAIAGGIRAGKTVGSVLRTLLICHEYPGIPGVVCRQTYPQLVATTLKEFENVVAEKNGGSLNPGPYIVKYNRSLSGVDALTMVLRSKDPERPSTILFRYADNIPNMLGLEVGFVFIDQMEGVEKDIVDHLDSRLSYWNESRAKEFTARYGYKPKHFLYATMNPDPGWVYDKFKLNPSNEWNFIEVSTKENIENLPPGYIEEQTKGKPDLWVKRWLDGSWDIRGGQIYSEFDDSLHVCEPFVIPKHWPRFIAMDWGFNHPTAIYWGAVGEDGVIYVYREYFQSGVLASDVAQNVIEMSKGDSVTKWNGAVEIYMPSDMWQHRGQVNHTVADEFFSKGITGIQANRSMEAGILRVQERLHPVDNKVGIKIFNNCKNLIRGMKLYTADEMTGRPIKKDDDAVDALRYLVMSILDNKAIQPMINKEKTHDEEFNAYALSVMNSNNTGTKEYL